MKVKTLLQQDRSPLGGGQLRCKETPRRGMGAIGTATLATTLGKELARLGSNPPLRCWMRPVTNEGTEFSTLVTATLRADLEGRVAAELVADIVRAVVAQSQQAAQHRGVEPTMFEARRRLERFVRVLSAS